MAAEKGRQVKWLTASMFQHSKGIATLPEVLLLPHTKTPLRSGTESSCLIFCTSDTESIVSAGQLHV